VAASPVMNASMEILDILWDVVQKLKIFLVKRHAGINAQMVVLHAIWEFTSGCAHDRRASEE
jgi:hypothetical protein